MNSLQSSVKIIVPDERERGKKNVITVSNATDMTVFVELHPIEMVRKGNTPALDLGLGMNAGTTNFAGTTIEVSWVVSELRFCIICKGQVSLTGEGSFGDEEVNGPSSLLVEHPPARCRANLIPHLCLSSDSNFSILHQQKAVLLHNSLFTR